jgi:hypothetical protein
MRSKILTLILLAGTVVGCASNPPPPEPVVAAPPPAPPAPMAVGPVDGKYKGMAELTADSAPKCAKMTKAQYVTVRKNTFFLMGVKATIGADGTIAATPRRGASVTGTATGTSLDLMAAKAKCTYHYTLTKG